MPSPRAAARTAIAVVAGALGIADPRDQLASVDEAIAAATDRANELRAERDKILEHHPLSADASKRLDAIDTALEAEARSADRLLITRSKLQRRIAAEDAAKANTERLKSEEDRRKYFAALFDQHRFLANAVDKAADNLRDHLEQLFTLTNSLRLEIDPTSNEVSQVLSGFSTAAGTVINHVLASAGGVCGKPAPFLQQHKQTVASWLPDAPYLRSLIKPRLVE